MHGTHLYDLNIQSSRREGIAVASSEVISEQQAATRSHLNKAINRSQ